MKKRDKTRREHLVRKIKFFLGENQTLYVNASLLGPGLNRLFVTNEGGKVEVWADATSGSHFRFSKGSGAPGDPDFEIANLDSAEALEDILDHKFWSQFNWGELIAYYKDRNFQRRVRSRIKKLVAGFEAHAAEELNAIPRPSNQ